MSPNNSVAEELVPLAASVREKGEHYGGFKVGCIGYYVDDDSNVRVFEGANTKRTPTEEKDCAEQKVMRAADRASVILKGLIIFGLPRIEDITRTLHACEVCRGVIRYYMKRGRVIEPTTQIICVNAQNGDMERFTVAELLAAHGESLDED